jgi:hypothetical protein
MDAPIMLLCRTGSRSVNAGNILANPESNAATAGHGALQTVHQRAQCLGGFSLACYKYAMLSNGEIAYDADGQSHQIRPEQQQRYRRGLRGRARGNQRCKPGQGRLAQLRRLALDNDIDDSLAYQQDPGLYEALNLTPVPYSEKGSDPNFDPWNPAIRRKRKTGSDLNFFPNFFL